MLAVRAFVPRLPQICGLNIWSDISCLVSCDNARSMLPLSETMHPQTRSDVFVSHATNNDNYSLCLHSFRCRVIPKLNNTKIDLLGLKMNVHFRFAAALRIYRRSVLCLL